MSKQKPKKLSVRSETIRNLSSTELATVVGGLGNVRSAAGPCGNTVF